MEVSKRKTVDHRALTRLNTIPWRRPIILNKDLLFMKYVVFKFLPWSSTYLPMPPTWFAPPRYRRLLGIPPPPESNRLWWTSDQTPEKVWSTPKRLSQYRMTTISIIIIAGYLPICSPFFKYTCSFVELITLLLTVK